MEQEFIVSVTKEFIVYGNNKKEVLEHYQDEFESGLNYSYSVEVQDA